MHGIYRTSVDAAQAEITRPFRLGKSVHHTQSVFRAYFHTDSAPGASALPGMVPVYNPIDPWIIQQQTQNNQRERKDDTGKSRAQPPGEFRSALTGKPGIRRIG